MSKRILITDDNKVLYQRFREAAPDFGFTDKFIRNDADFETLFSLLRQGPPISVVDTLSKLADVTNQVCQIADTTTNTPLGTGFLVGGDLVLTAFHVMNGRDFSKLNCSFNNIGFTASQVTSNGPTVVGIDGTKPVDSSELGIGQAVMLNAFDFMLFRLTGAVGGVSRKFVALAPISCVEGDSVYLVEYPGSSSVSFSGGTVTKPFNPVTQAAFLHNAQASGGASGAPVFNNKFEVIGLHRGSVSSTDNEAIDISRIYAQVHTNGHI